MFDFNQPHTESTEKTEQTKRLSGLDFVRFVLAMAVLLFHYLNAAPAVHVVNGVDRVEFLSYGRFAVQAFFMISGYVIVKSMAGKSPVQFLANRFLRLYPALAVCAPLTFLITHALALPSEVQARGGALVHGLLFLPLVKQQIPGLDWSYWSLTYELRFYACIALTMPLLTRPLWLLVGTAAWIASSCLVKWDELGAMLLIPYSGFFIAGILLHLVEAKENWIRTSSWLLLVPTMALCAKGVLVENELQGWDHLAPVTIGDAAAIAFGALGLVFVAVRINLPRLEPIAAILGAMSYPLYLVHGFAGYALINRLTGVGLPAAAAVPSAAAFSIGVAWAVCRYAEPAIKSVLRAGLTKLGVL